MTDLTDTDLAESARIAYAAGISPVDHAEREITVLIGIHNDLAMACTRPGVKPHGDLSEDALSRRIIGLLLSAGWEPPGGLEIPGKVPS